jgi:hypothetical protein
MYAEFDRLLVVTYRALLPFAELWYFCALNSARNESPMRSPDYTWTMSEDLERTSGGGYDRARAAGVNTVPVFIAQDTDSDDEPTRAEFAASR